MSKALAPRKPTRTLITPDLRRRQRLSFIEVLRVGLFFVLCLVGLLLLTGGIVGLAVKGPGMDPALAVPMMVSGVLSLLGGAIAIDQGTGLTARRQQVIWDRGRKGRAHVSDERGRLADIRYPRYSLWPERDGKTLKLHAIQHDTCWPFGWHATKTKKLYDVDQGRWITSGEAISTTMIHEPTVDNVMKAVARAQEIVEELENKAYAEKLQERQLDLLAVAMHPPPLGPETQAKLIVTEERVKELMGEEV